MKKRLPSLVLRVLAILSFAVPLTPVFDGPPFKEPRYLLLLDSSPSMAGRFPGFAEEALGEWAAAGGGTRHVLAFADFPGDRAARPRETDLASALAAAADTLPPRSESRILLVTDGLTGQGGLPEALSRLKDRGARVYALSPPSPVRQAGVVEIVLPQQAYLWEPFPVKGRIASSAPGVVEAELQRNGVTVDRASVQVDGQGYAEVEFLQEADRVGEITYGLALPAFSLPPAVGSVRIASSPRVRYIADDLLSARPLIELFRRAGVEVSTSSPSDLVHASGEIVEDDVLILDDVPAPALDAASFDLIRKAVASEGKGLIVIGGRKGLGSQDYGDSPLESLLPVTSGFSTPPDPVPVSMVIAMDTSFSMAYRGGGSGAHGSEPRKIDLAKASVKEVVRVSRPGDRLGIIGNSTDLFWIHELGEVDDPRAVGERIDGVSAKGDGINFFSIVREGFTSLAEDGAAVRHLLVFADAEDIDQYEVTGAGHSFDLIREMSRQGITLSILAIGRPGDKDVPFLRTATLLGKGDFYLLSNLRVLPRYFVSEYKKLSARHFLEEQVMPAEGEYSRLLFGVKGTLPRLDGIALVTPRSGSETPLRTDAGIPLVATGRYGRGRTAVFASDNGYRWAGRWVRWSEAERFWLQLLFAVTPQEFPGGEGSTSLAADPGRNRLLLRHRTGWGGPPPWESLVLVPRGSEGSPLRLQRTGLMEYRSEDPLPDPGFYRFRVVTEEGEGEEIAQVSVGVPLVPESLPLRENWPVVEKILEATGGTWLPSPKDVFSGRTYYNIDRSLLAALAIAAGLTLLLIESAVTHSFWR